MIPRYAEMPYDMCAVYGHALKESPWHQGTFYCTHCDLIEALRPSVGVVGNQPKEKP